MPRPCGHTRESPVAGCSLCAVAAREPGYAVRWDGVPLPGLTAPTRTPSRGQVLRRELPCVHRGQPIGEQRPRISCGQRHRQAEVHACTRHGQCSVTGQVAGAAWCTRCNDYLPQTAQRTESGPARFEWVSTADLARDTVILAGLLPADCAGIVGVPRSGLIPAAMIAAQLHLPLYELASGGPRRLGHGSRGGSLRQAGGPLAVIDDTVYGGGAIGRARAAMRGQRAVYAVVYARPVARAAVDLFARLLPSPHLLEWNFGNNGPMRGLAANPVYGQGLAWDLDGVICHDEHSGGRPGAPYLVPRAHPVRLIVTGRRESHRASTEAWLRQAGVRWDRLEMLPDGVHLTAESAAAHKGKQYGSSRCGFFIESDPVQAELIWQQTGKPVICPRAGRVFQ